MTRIGFFFVEINGAAICNPWTFRKADIFAKILLEAE